jgi:signal transduction histidine kinase
VAAVAGRKGGVVSVDLLPEQLGQFGKGQRLVIRDNGVGMPEDVLKVCFRYDLSYSMIFRTLCVLHSTE